MNHNKLEWWSFAWSEARLVIAAVALAIGGVPPFLFVAINVPGAFTLSVIILKVCWLISGASAAYLLYRWAEHKTVFGGKDRYDSAAFAVMVVSGLNLGVTGIVSQNPGLTIFQSYPLYLLTAVAYLVSAVYLYRRWNQHGQKLF